MEKTTEEISRLLNFAFNSNLTAQEIIDRVSDTVDSDPVKKITLKKLFSVEKMLEVCGSDTKMGLIKRIRNSLFGRGYYRWNREIFDLPVSDAVKHQDFKQVKMWGYCGKKCHPIIYKMFQSVKVDVL